MSLILPEKLFDDVKKKVIKKPDVITDNESDNHQSDNNQSSDSETDDRSTDDRSTDDRSTDSSSSETDDRSTNSKSSETDDRSNDSESEEKTKSPIKPKLKNKQISKPKITQKSTKKIESKSGSKSTPKSDSTGGNFQSKSGSKPVSKTKSKSALKTKSNQIPGTKNMPKKNKIDLYSDSESNIDNDNDDSSENEINDTTEQSIDIDPPVYDDKEPYFIFRRKWDYYVQNKLSRNRHTKILSFMNDLLKTNVKSLIMIKNIDPATLPSTQDFIDLMASSDKDYGKAINLRIDISQENTTISLINALLSRVDYSFVEVHIKKKILYTIKPKIIPRDKDYINN